ncbi:MAG: hypothetical protein AAF934_01775, partial [Bacteroidota bacterium]
QKHRKFLKKLLISLFVLIPLLVFLVVSFQKPFNSHQFELGTVKEFTGIYHKKPIPILEVSPKALPETFSNHILLVGYGKFGAEGIMKAIEKEYGDLAGKKITIRGTLIYGDGKTLMELTEQENSLIEIYKQPSGKGSNIKTPSGNIALEGEILDPKCYFGVMKPGEGKIHKSCAIRCISGGIPPVFRTAAADKNGFDYYILLGTNGIKINAEVLPFVAERIKISGSVSHRNGWDIVYIHPKDIAILQ